MGFGKDGKGVIHNVNLSQAIGTLGTSTGLFVGTKPVLAADFRMLKTEITARIVGLTAGVTELPLTQLYLVDGDLSLAEAEASIEAANVPLGPNDRVGMELAERFVKLIGVGDHGVGIEVFRTLHDIHEDSNAILAKPRWTFKSTKSWNWMLYNTSADAPTTGANIVIQGRVFGVWIR